MFTSDMAAEAAQQLWFFKPSRDIKTVHLFNALLRELCGGTPGSLTLLRTVVATHPNRPNARAEKFLYAQDLANDPAYADFRAATAGPLTEANVEALRLALDAVLQQDGAFFGGFDKDKTERNGGALVFGSGSLATLTLTHWRHLTADPSDNRAGHLLAGVLLAAPAGSAVRVLREVLLDENDTTTRLTAPLLPTPVKTMPAVPSIPEATARHLADSPVLADLQAAFETLVSHRQALGKFELLARAGRLASFGLWVHVLNAGRPEAGRQPLLLCGPQAPPAVKTASHNGVGLMHKQLRRAYTQALDHHLTACQLHKNLTAADYQSWADAWDEKERERFKLEIRQKTAAGQTPFRAVCQALVEPAMRRISRKREGTDKKIDKKEGPDKYINEQARRLGLFPAHSGRTGYHLRPGPPFYDMLVAALLPPGRSLTARQFWQQAYAQFGLLCGVRGAADLADLARAGITGLTPAHLAANAQSVLAELTRQGYARAHADGETILALP